MLEADDEGVLLELEEADFACTHGVFVVCVRNFYSWKN